MESIKNVKGECVICNKKCKDEPYKCVKVNAYIVFYCSEECYKKEDDDDKMPPLVNDEAIYKEDEDEEDQHICGFTGGKNFVKGCGDKVHASDTFMIDNTSFCIPCYEKYENEEDENN